MADLPHAIFFDMDGTILDWRTGMEECWLASCRAHSDGSFDPAALHDAIRDRRDWFWQDPQRARTGRLDLDEASREIVRRAFDDHGLTDVGLAHRLSDDYRARRAGVLAPYPGAIETLAAVRERGTRTALLTNGGATGQRQSIQRFGLEQYFDCIVIEGEFGAGKPDERVFRHALHACAARPETTWMIGDSLEADIAPARQLGMHTVWVAVEGVDLPSEPSRRPHRVVQSIRELL